jgi:hypothetical protein
MPEWFAIPDLFSNLGGRLNVQPEMANTFAITPARRLAVRPEEQDSYQATKSGCPSCPAQTGSVYEQMLLLFTGIQAAGPRLTVENVDRGLHAIPPRQSPSPWTPAAYFAPGNWSFFKDMMLVRWDPAGANPGAPPGCWRAVEYGKRYRADDWSSHSRDDDFDRFDEWPCHGEG